jgi:hypothetical protein
MNILSLEKNNLWMFIANLQIKCLTLSSILNDDQNKFQIISFDEEVYIQFAELLFLICKLKCFYLQI